MDRKTTVQSLRELSSGRHAQNEVQVSTFPGSDEDFDSDIQSNISSRSGNTSEGSETDLDPDAENDELNNEVGEDGLYDTLEEEDSRISISVLKRPIHVILDNQLDQNIPKDTSLRSAFYSIISSDTAEIWALGEVTRLNLRAGWPDFDTLFHYIEIRDYGCAVCPTEIYQEARQSLCVGGMIHYIQILFGVPEKSRYDHHKSDMDQDLRMPTHFSIYKVLELSLGSEELGSQDLSMKAIYSSWKKQNDCEDESRDIFA